MRGIDCSHNCIGLRDRAEVKPEKGRYNLPPSSSLASILFLCIFGNSEFTNYEYKED